MNARVRSNACGHHDRPLSGRAQRLAMLVMRAVAALAAVSTASAAFAQLPSDPGKPAVARVAADPPPIHPPFRLMPFGGAAVGIRTGEQPGSGGLSGTMELDADKQYVLSIEVAPARGHWSLRLDAGSETSARWFPFSGAEQGKLLRIAGVGTLRLMVYSDDAGAETALKGLEIRSAAADADWDIPLAFRPTELELARQRALWLPHLAPSARAGAIELAKAIASFVYCRSRTTGPNEPEFNGFGAAQPWLADPSKTVNGLCGSFAQAMVDLCTRLGVYARLANMATRRFATGLASGDTHVLVEVFEPVSQRWVLMDPTFNTAFRGPSGEHVGLKELFQLADARLKWTAEPIGPLRPGRSIQEYYLTYEDLLFVVSAPAVPELGDLGCEFRSQQRTVQEIQRERYPSTSGR